MTDQFLKEVSAELRISGEVNSEEADAIEKIGGEYDTVKVDSAMTVESPPSTQSETDSLHGDLRTKIRDLRFPEKIKLALYGNQLSRAILIFDVNKIIQQCVLRNPKITAREIEDFCKSPNIAQAVLRSVSERAEWMKSYPLKEIIVTNPKTPSDIALKWIKFLNASEIKKIAKSKGLPQVVVTAARRRVQDFEQKKTPG